MSAGTARPRGHLFSADPETLDDARIGGYVDRYHHGPHSGLNYRTPYEVKQTWKIYKHRGLTCQPASR